MLKNSQICSKGQLDEVLLTVNPAGDGEHRHQSVAQPHTLSLSADSMWSSSHYHPL